MNERRFRVVQTPEPHEIEQARLAGAGWPMFDVIDPPTWLAELAGRDIPRESFKGLVRQLAAEGYEFSYQRLAWIKPT